MNFAKLTRVAAMALFATLTITVTLATQEQLHSSHVSWQERSDRLERVCVCRFPTSAIYSAKHDGEDISS